MQKYIEISVLMRYNGIAIGSDNMNVKNITFDKRYYNISELITMGLSYYKIKNLVDEGRLSKLNKSLYENSGFDGDANDFETVCAYVHQGIICMLSAAKFYNLTNYIPDSIDIAIDRKMKISSYPDNPSINVWYFSSERYEDEIIDKGNIKIYSVEKTVVDIIYYRNRVGIEETKEVLKNYLARDDRDLVRLHRLASRLGCIKILKTYLEVLI